MSKLKFRSIFLSDIHLGSKGCQSKLLLEALACGTPLAAYPVTGPKDLIVNGVNGFTDDNLLNAIDQAVKVPSSGCIDFASRFTWDKVAEQFKNALVPKSLESSYKNSSRPYLSIWR